MENTTKKQIATALRACRGHKGSQNKTATAVGCHRKDWVVVETRDYRLMKQILADAQDNALVMAITGEAGTGKTVVLRNYAETGGEVFMLSCNEYWNRKDFLQQLLATMGRHRAGYKVSEMMHEAVEALKAADCPMIIADEMDKLSDQVLYFFITLYNQLEDHCSMVMVATDHLAKRIHRGVRNNKKGYKELYSRMGRRFIELKGLGAADIAAVCKANGITDAGLIKQVVDDSDGDMRRVKRKVHAVKRRM